jgi:hypothetical protein
MGADAFILRSFASENKTAALPAWGAHIEDKIGSGAGLCEVWPGEDASHGKNRY